VYDPSPVSNDDTNYSVSAHVDPGFMNALNTNRSCPENVRGSGLPRVGSGRIGSGQDLCKLRPIGSGRELYKFIFGC